MEKTLNKLMIFVGLFIFDILYTSIITTILKYFGLDVMTLDNALKSILLIIVNISFMLILYFIYKNEINTEIKRYFKYFKKNFRTGLSLWIIGLILMVITNLIIQSIYPHTPSNEEAVQASLKSLPLYSIFATCIFAPFTEEIIFRKCLHKAFKNKFLFIIISGLLFGLAHTITGIGTNQMLYTISYGLFGSIFAYMYIKTKTIFVPITFHFIHNTIFTIISIYSIGGNII